MVKGEHLRPLLGFVVVCCTAALILATGVTSPGALRRIVAQQQVLPAAGLTELVLGRTFDPAPKATATPTAAPVVAKAEPSLVLASFRAPEAAAVRPSSPRHAHHAGHHAAQHVSAAAAVAPTHQVSPATTQPTIPSVSPATPVVAGGGAHHALQASASPDEGADAADGNGSVGTRDHSHGHRWDHSRAHGDRHRDRHPSPAASHPADQGHQSQGAGWAAHSQPAGTTTSGDPHAQGDHGHDHSHGGHADNDHSRGQDSGDHSHGGHSHGHGH